MDDWAKEEARRLSPDHSPEILLDKWADILKIPSGDFVNEDLRYAAATIRLLRRDVLAAEARGLERALAMFDERAQNEHEAKFARRIAIRMRESEARGLERAIEAVSAAAESWRQYADGSEMTVCEEIAAAIRALKPNTFDAVHGFKHSPAMTTDSPPRRFAAVADTKPGDLLEADGSVGGITAGTYVEVHLDDGRLWVPCPDGQHFLEAVDGAYPGFFRAPEEESDFSVLFPGAKASPIDGKFYAKANGNWYLIFPVEESAGRTRYEVSRVDYSPGFED